MSAGATILAVVQAVRLGSVLLAEYQAGTLTEEEFELKWVRVRGMIANTENEWMDMENEEEEEEY